MSVTPFILLTNVCNKQNIMSKYHTIYYKSEEYDEVDAYQIQIQIQINSLLVFHSSEALDTYIFSIDCISHHVEYFI